jgi:uncharacterized protein YjbI with pentapeptide repeats
MINRFFLAMATVFFIASCSGAAFATSCMIPTCAEELAQHGAVFKGKVVSSGSTSPQMREEYTRKKNPDMRYDRGLPNTYSDFEVGAVYKGVLGSKVRIFYETRPATMIAGDFDINVFPDGKEMTIYASRVGGFLVTYVGLCSGCHGQEALETIREQYDALENLIQQYPQTAEFYTKKIALYEGNKDFEAAVATYERLFAAVPDLRKKTDLRAGYGRNLQFAGRLEDALKVLAEAGDAPGAATDMQLSLLRLGRAADLSGKKPNLAGQRLSEITIRDADFTGADFSGAVLEGVKFINVKLQGANFANAKIQAEFSNCDAGGARFEGAEFRYGKIVDSKFDKAVFIKANLDLGETSRNSFRGADFTDAKLHIMEGRMQAKGAEASDFSDAKFSGTNIGGLGGHKITGADFTGASFYSGRSTASQNQGLDLSGQKFDNSKMGSSDFTGGSFKGASLRNAIFTGAVLKEVDFSGADLAGADFSVSSYSGPTKLYGANFSSAKIDGVKWDAADYDCATKFPAGFVPADNFMAVKSECPYAKTGPVNYSWENMLEPPGRHYRLMAESQPFQFKDADFTNANFEGIRLGTFWNVNMKGANLRHAKGGLDVGDGGSLEGADLSYADLGRGHYAHKTKPSAKGAKLFCTNMRDISGSADFSEADWTGAIMNSLNFSKWPDALNIDPVKNKVIFIRMEEVIAKFGPADFSGIDFTGCDFNYVDFATSNLSNTKFKGVYLYATNFDDANLTGANFDGARVMYNTKFPPDFDLTKFKTITTQTQNADSSPFAASELRRKHQDAPFMDKSPKGYQVHDFPGEDFSKLYFPASWLPGSNMKAAKMRMTNWQASNFQGANLSNVDATGAVFFDAVLSHADLTGATLYGADFRSAKLTDARLENANLKNALYDASTEWPSGFDPVKAGAFFVVKKERPY